MLKGFYLGPLFLAWSDLLLTLLLLCAILPLGWFYGRRLARRGLDMNTAFEKGPRAWIVLLGFLGLCVMIGVIYRLPHAFSPGLLAILEPASWLAAKSGAVFLAAMAVPLGQGRRRAVMAAGLLGSFCVLAVIGLQGWFVRPISQKEIFVRIGSDGSILQSTGVTCTAAAFANALRLFGIEASEAESARVLGTRDSGTTDRQLLSGAHYYGLFAHYVSVRPQHVVRMNRPALVSFDLKVILHSILVYGHDAKGNLLIVDPISGKGKLTPKQYAGKLKINDGVVLTDRPVPELTPDSPKFLIHRVQTILQTEGYLASVSDTYDGAMTEAVKAFQSHWQLPASGRIDDQTWLLLTGPYEPTRVLPAKLAHS
ncbi:MAG: peptidoglycan-binding protein [Candidatus Sericytochromatia bacterium]